MFVSHWLRRLFSDPFAIPIHLDRSEFVRELSTLAARKLKLRAGNYDPLTQLAAQYRSDKGVTIYPFHGYSIHYAKLFEPLRMRPINLLEIGLATPNNRSTLNIICPSLQMWIDYFPLATVYGFDIDDFSWVKMPRTHILRGDQGNPDDLLRIIELCRQFDIIIDDGSHASFHQQTTLKTLFPSLASGGIYIIEDLLFQPDEIEHALPMPLKTKEALQDETTLGQLVEGVKEVCFFNSPLDPCRQMEMVAITKS